MRKEEPQLLQAPSTTALEENQGRRHVPAARQQVPVSVDRGGKAPWDFDFSPVVAGWPDLAHGALMTVEVTAGASRSAACSAC